MRNLELELSGRPIRRERAALLPAPRLTPAIRLALSVLAIAILLLGSVALGYRGPAALALLLVAVAALVGGREGVEMSAWVGVGILPYLVLVLLLSGRV